MKIGCVISGCGRKVDDQWCLCGEHYRVIPADLRDALTRAYNRHLPVEDQASGFVVALVNIQAWIVKTFGEEQRERLQTWEQVVTEVRARDAARRARSVPPPPVPHLRLVP